MTPFKIKTISFVNDYRRILRRFVSDQTREEIIAKLQLKEKKLRHKTELELYHLGYMILHDIEKWRINGRDDKPEHCGVTQFYRELKSYLTQFRIINRQVINLCQVVSNAMLHMLQLVHQPSSDNVFTQLNQHLNVIQEHATIAEKSKLLAMIKRSESTNTQAYHPLILKLESDLN